VVLAAGTQQEIANSPAHGFELGMVVDRFPISRMRYVHPK